MKLNRKKKVAILSVLILGAFLLIPVPISVKIVEGEGESPPEILKYIGVLNLTFNIQNFSMCVTIDNKNYTFSADEALIKIKSWEKDNVTYRYVSMLTKSANIESENLKLYVASLTLDIYVEISGDWELYRYYAYADTVIPMYMIIQNLLASALW